MMNTEFDYLKVGVCVFDRNERQVFHHTGVRIVDLTFGKGMIISPTSRATGAKKMSTKTPEERQNHTF